MKRETQIILLLPSHNFEAYHACNHATVSLYEWYSNKYTQSIEGFIVKASLAVATSILIDLHYIPTIAWLVILPKCPSYLYFDPLRQIDTSDADLPDEKMLGHSYSGIEDDTFQASMIALHGSTCSTDLDYLHSSTPKVRTFIYKM